MSRESPHEKVPSPLWRRCPPGKFEDLTRKLQRRRQRRQFLRAAGAVAVAAVGGGITFWLAKPTVREPGLEDISCGEVRQLAGAYARGELPPTTRERVRQHLAGCPQCSALFRSMGIQG